jgi:hypothetical protein
MNYIKVLDHDYLVRDPSTGAIINTDKTSLEDIKKLRTASSTIKNIQSDVENLKSELCEIKNLLKELIRNGNT